MAAAAKVYVNGWTATLFRDGDKPIYLLADGRFAVLLGERWEVRATIKTLERLANAGRKTLLIFNSDRPSVYPNGKIVEVLASEFIKSSVRDANGKHVCHPWGDWFVLDDSTRIDKLKALVEKVRKIEEEIDAEYDAIMAGTVEVNESNFKRLLASGGKEEPTPEIFDD